MDLKNLKILNKKLLVKKYDKAQNKKGPFVTGFQNPQAGLVHHIDPTIEADLKKEGVEVGMVILYSTKREAVFVGSEQFEMMEYANVFGTLGFPEEA